MKADILYLNQYSIIENKDLKTIRKLSFVQYIYNFSQHQATSDALKIG